MIRSYVLNSGAGPIVEFGETDSFDTIADLVLEDPGFVTSVYEKTVFFSGVQTYVLIWEP